MALLIDPSIDQTQFVAPVGSPLYMSSEQFRAITFFGEFGRGQLWELLLRCSDWIECEAGTTVTSAAHSGDAGLYVVFEGALRSGAGHYGPGACFNAKAFSGVSSVQMAAVTTAHTTLAAH